MSLFIFCKEVESPASFTETELSNKTMKYGFSKILLICFTIGPSKRKASRNASVARKPNRILFHLSLHGCLDLYNKKANPMAAIRHTMMYAGDDSKIIFC